MVRGSAEAASAKTVVVHSSWRGRFLAFVGPAGLAVLGAYGVIVGGLHVVNGGLVVVGGVLLVASLFDFPLQTHFGVTGACRRCVGRAHQLEWAEIGSIARAPGRRVGPRTSSGGLVAVRGRRNYLLSDRAESRYEHEALRSAVSAWAGPAVFRASEPVDGAAPSWLYKRRVGEGLVDER